MLLRSGCVVPGTCRVDIARGTAIGAYPGRLRTPVEMQQKVAKVPMAAQYTFVTSESMCIYYDASQHSAAVFPPAPGYQIPIFHLTKALLGNDGYAVGYRRSSSCVYVLLWSSSLPGHYRVEKRKSTWHGSAAGDQMYLDPTDMTGLPSQWPVPGWPWPLPCSTELAYANEPPPNVGGTNCFVEDGEKRIHDVVVMYYCT